MAEQLAYELGDASDEDINAMLAEVWGKRNSDPALRKSLLDLGLTEEELKSEQPPLRAERPAEGLFPIGVVLLAVVAKITVHVANQIFDEIILPRLKERFGGKAVGQQVEPKED